MKKCSKCFLEKNYSEFNKDKNKSDGFGYRCKDCNKEVSKLWYAVNKEKQNIYMREWYQKNIDSQKNSAKLWRLENKDSKRESNRKRKVLLKGNNHSPYTDKQVIEIYGSVCHLCNIEIDMQASRQSGKPGWQMGLQIDHVIPLSKGGDDSIDNVKPSHGICNLVKNNHVIE